MKMLAIYNSTNKKFRRDGDEFAREARKWAGTQLPNSGSVPHVVDVQDGRVRAEIRKMKLAPGVNGLDVLAIFDHGTPRGLPRMRESLGNVKGLAETIAGVTKKITVVLFSCSCGRGWWGRFGFRWMNKRNKRDMKTPADSYSPRDGYAVALCCELAKLGVNAEVWAHLTKGHTTRNPHVVEIDRLVFIGETDAEAKLTVYRGRFRAPGNFGWKQWKRDLKGPLRFTFWRNKT